MAFYAFNPKKPVRVRPLSPLGFYPRHSVIVPGARLIVREDLIASIVELLPPEEHGLTDEHFSELEFLALEEIRFFAALVLAVHPDDGMAYIYPLPQHVDVSAGLNEDTMLGVMKEQVSLLSKSDRLNMSLVFPPFFGGPNYNWRDVGVDVIQVLEIARATKLKDHLLMRGLGSLLRSDMCWQHREIAEAAIMQLHVALDASFQIMLRTLREMGISNPSAKDAGNLLDEMFNPGIESGNYFQDYYDVRIKAMHPVSRFGVFPIAPLESDDYYFLRHGLVEIYHWLITRRS